MQNKKKSPFNFNPFKKKQPYSSQSSNKKLADITDLIEQKEKSSQQLTEPGISTSVEARTPGPPVLQKSKIELEDENQIIERKIQTKRKEIENFG